MNSLPVVSAKIESKTNNENVKNVKKVLISSVELPVVYLNLFVGRNLLNGVNSKPAILRCPLFVIRVLLQNKTTVSLLTVPKQKVGSDFCQKSTVASDFSGASD